VHVCPTGFSFTVTLYAAQDASEGKRAGRREVQSPPLSASPPSRTARTTSRPQGEEKKKRERKERGEVLGGADGVLGCPDGVAERGKGRKRFFPLRDDGRGKNGDGEPCGAYCTVPTGRRSAREERGEGRLPG